ncbi:MAG: sodium:proton exchanger, partial [Microbacteriaceae bacterium]|nr:sodium:proton exchanger [Microbacteriaceae bacterium]
AILISSKLNQWTLLAGSMPIAYIIGGGDNAALPVVGRSAEEMWLTSAMTLLGVALLLKLRWGLAASVITLSLFLFSVIPDETFRVYLGYVHLVVAIGYFWVYRDQVVPTLKAVANRVKK